MTPTDRFVFSGHAVGAAAQFTRLGVTPVAHVIPALGASVLPPTGGLSKSDVSNYSFEISKPQRRTLLSVHRIDTMAAGRITGTRFDTETEARIESIWVTEKLHIDYVRVHVLATREGMDGEPKTSSQGNKLTGVRLGKVDIVVDLDEEAMGHCGTSAQLKKFLAGRGQSLVEQDGVCAYSLVRGITLKGEERDTSQIQVVENGVHWDPFGWIFFGEVILKAHDRQVTMVRLQMGSDDGGAGTVGDGQSNGQVVHG